MISTAFDMRAPHAVRESHLIGVVLAIGVAGFAAKILAATALGMVLLLALFVGLIFAFVRYGSGIMGAQTLVTTLESDGVTVWAFNERRPDVEKKGRCGLFAARLDQIGACESGKAYDLFGNNLRLGAVLILPEKSRIMSPAHVTERKEKRDETKAIYLRSSDGLHLIYADNITSALGFDLVGQINRFLADARALRAPAPDLAAPASASGFDV